MKIFLVLSALAVLLLFGSMLLDETGLVTRRQAEYAAAGLAGVALLLWLINKLLAARKN